MLDELRKDPEAFQFTPLREGRLGGDAGKETAAGVFQFTPLREGRRGYAMRTYAQHSISIHAPPRGATFPASGIPGVGKISIHAPPRGATMISLFGAFVKHFNSRPSARGDVSVWDKQAETCQKISIHAPPRGATMRLRRGWGDDNISIHAPPRGATA